MRRLLALATVVTTTLALAIVLPLPALAADDNYEDTFPSANYTSSTGSLTWSGPWQEVGESNGAGSGAVQVVSSLNCAGSRCLRITDASSVGVYRQADLSAAETAVLRVRVKRVPDLVLLSDPDGDLVIQMRPTSSGSWTTLDTFDLANGDLVPDLHTYNVSSLNGSSAQVRFLVVDAQDTQVYIDNVEIELTYPPPPTTTTTSTTTTITVPTTLPTTTTSTTVQASSTTTRPRNSTTTTEQPTTTNGGGGSGGGSGGTSATSTTEPGGSGGGAGDPDNGPGDGPGATAPGPSDQELALAQEEGVSLDLAPQGQLQNFRTDGLNPLTGLTVGFETVVETIRGEILSALGLGLMVALFAIRIPRDKDDLEPAEIEPPSTDIPDA